LKGNNLRPPPANNCPLFLLDIAVPWFPVGQANWFQSPVHAFLRKVIAVFATHYEFWIEYTKLQRFHTLHWRI
jgi:hypothetical protein